MRAGGVSRPQRRARVHPPRAERCVGELFGMLAAGLFACAWTAAVQAEPRPLTLEEAVAMAQRNAPAVVQALGQERTSAAGVRSAWGAFLPSLSVNAGAVRQLPASGGTTRIDNGQVVELPAQVWSSSLGLGVSLQLFGGGERLFGLRQARARDSMADLDLIEQRYQTWLEARKLAK